MSLEASLPDSRRQVRLFRSAGQVGIGKQWGGDRQLDFFGSELPNHVDLESRNTGTQVETFVLHELSVLVPDAHDRLDSATLSRSSP